MPIAIVTCSEFPIADQDMALRDALRDQILSTKPDFIENPNDPLVDIVPWNMPRVDWSRYDATVISTPWDYVHQRESFFTWLDNIEQHTTVLNPPEVIRRNAHKRYLLDMQAKRVPIIPTTLVEQTDSNTDPFDIANQNNWNDFIIKPEVGAGASGLLRVILNNDSESPIQEQTWTDDPHAPNPLDSGITTSPDRARAHLTRILTQTPALIQPYLQGVEQGETSLIYFNGEFSHAVRKTPKETDIRVQHEFGGSYKRHTPTDAELTLATAAINAESAQHLPYCRVDCIESNNAQPLLIELELFEPQLFTDHNTNASDARARAILTALSTTNA